MAKGRSKRWVKHEYGKGVHAIRYRLKPLPKLALSSDDERTACAQIVDNQVIDEPALYVKIMEEAPFLHYHEVKAVLDVMQSVLLKEFRRGHRMTFKNFMSLWPTFSGRVKPEQHLGVTRLPLVMNARFSEGFNTLLNKPKSLQIQYAGELQPCEVVVETVERFDNLLCATGKFHNIGSLETEVQVGEQAVPCEYRLSKKTSSTRNCGKSLNISVPANVLPKEGSFTILFSWLDGAGTERHLSYPM